MKFRFAIALACVVIGTTVAWSSSVQSGDDTEAIRGLFEQYDATTNRGDLAGWLALLTDDVLWMAPDQASLVGHAGVKARVEPWFEQLDMEC